MVPISRAAERDLRVVVIKDVLPWGPLGHRVGEHRVSTIWSATVCTVAGAAIGGMLPAIGDWVAHGRDRQATRPRAVRRVRILMAATTTALTMGVYGYLHVEVTVVASCWLTVTGVCLALVDIDCQRLPRVLVVAMAVGGLVVFVPVAIADDRLGSLVTALVAAGMTGVFALAVALAVPEGIGLGDVTLLPVLALFLGWYGWPVVVSGLIIGWVLTGLVVVERLVVRGARRGTRIAAGPALILGSIITIAVTVGNGGGL